MLPDVESVAGAVTATLPVPLLLEAADGATDDVSDLLGADPAGGVATLVSLVTITDVIALPQDASGAGEVVQGGTSDLLDTLSADATGATAPPDKDPDAGAGADVDDAPPLLTPISNPLDPPDLPGGLG